MRIILLIFLFVSQIEVLGSDSDEIKNLVHLSQNNGLASNHIMSISEDMYNRIWICSDEGINIFNGEQVYPLSKMIKNDSINFYHFNYVVSEGNKMLLGGESGIFEYDTELNTFSKILSRVITNSPTSIVPTQNGSYILMDGCIYLRRNNDFKVIAKDLEYRSIISDKQNALWVSTWNSIYHINQNGSNIESYNIGKEINSNVLITSLYCDSKGLIWVGTKNHGIFRYDKGKNAFINALRLHDQPENICSIGEDNIGNLWIGYNKGVVIFDYINQNIQWKKLTNADGQNFNSTVCQIFKTSKDDIVLGTYFDGAFYIKSDCDWLHFIQVKTNEYTIGVVANNIIMTKGNQLIVATNSEGVYFFDSNYKELKHFNSRNSIVPDNIIALCEDTDQTIWLGSESNGLYKIEKNGLISHLQADQKNNGLSSNLIFSILQIDNTNLLICNSTQIQILNRKNMNFINICKVTSPVYDAKVIDDNIWICSQKELISYNLKNKKLTTIPSISSSNMNLNLSCFFFAQDTLWIGTMYNSLHYLNAENKIVAYSSLADFNKQIFGIIRDSFHQFWLTTNDGIYCQKNEHPPQKINTISGLNTNRFNQRSTLYYNNIVYLGSTNGICYFNPAQAFMDKTNSAKLELLDFRLFNVSQRNNKDFFPNGITNAKEIKLNFDQNIISFDLEQINYDFQNRTNYRILYQLHSFNENWYELPNDAGLITYTALSPGKYTLNIKLVDYMNQTIDTKSLRLIVKPHFLLTKIMLAGYLAFFILVTTFILNLVKKRHEERNQLHLNELEKEQLKKMTESKLDFFAFITNELKSPLSVIAAINEDLFSRNQLLDTNEFQISERNINRLLVLINQLIEFRILSKNNMQLNNSKYELVTFCESISKLFIPLFKANNITYFFEKPEKLFELNFDGDKLEKIISNILGNIVKISPPNSSVWFIVQQNVSFNQAIMIFSVSETILSIESIEKLFKPFEITPDINNNFSPIGLALVSQLINAIDGKIEVNAIEDKGIYIKLVIPTNKDATIQYVQNIDLETTKQILNDFVLPQFETENNHNNNHHLNVLIADNNADFTFALANKLKNKYLVNFSTDGRMAMQIIESKFIDIVIANINLPWINGFELCNSIKNHPKLKHIPVILMSSETSIQNKIKSYKLNADGYLEKPFHIDELLLRINSLLQNKESLRDYFRQVASLEIKQGATTKEESFVKEVNKIISDNLSNPDFNTTSLAKILKISHTKLYIRTKEVANLCPSLLIVKYKMEYSKQLLNDHSISIKEIADQLGYNSSNYFSKQFKAFYNISPTQYRDGKSENEL